MPWPQFPQQAGVKHPWAETVSTPQPRLCTREHRDPATEPGHVSLSQYTQHAARFPPHPALSLERAPQEHIM